jgi:hypothetical protein
MLDDEVRQILRELVEELGARSAVITEAPEERSGVPARTLPLGGGGFLRVELGTRSHAGQTVDVALERCVRALRAAARRWEAELPALSVGVGAGAASDDADAAGVTLERVKERIGAYLSALAAIGQVENTVLLVKGAMLASGRPLQQLEEARWPFIARRVAAAREAGSSHGELADPDFYAVEFWYGATLVLYLTPPYALDFVRFRCRQVTRELAQLLPLLEPDPAAPAAIRPTD